MYACTFYFNYIFWYYLFIECIPTQKWKFFFLFWLFPHSSGLQVRVIFTHLFLSFVSSSNTSITTMSPSMQSFHLLFGSPCFCFPTFFSFFCQCSLSTSSLYVPATTALSLATQKCCIIFCSDKLEITFTYIFSI